MFKSHSGQSSNLGLQTGACSQFLYSDDDGLNSSLGTMARTAVTTKGSLSHLISPNQSPVLQESAADSTFWPSNASSDPHSVFGGLVEHENGSSPDSSTTRKHSILHLLSPDLPDDPDPKSAAIDYFGTEDEEEDSASPFANEELLNQQTSVAVPKNLPYNPRRMTPATSDFYTPLTSRELAELQKARKNPLLTIEDGQVSAPVMQKSASNQYVPPPVPHAVAVASGKASKPSTPLTNGDAPRKTSQKRPREDVASLPPSKRSRAEIVKTEAVESTTAQQVAKHYNVRPNITTQDRRNSPIIGLKYFNNWIKTVLINKHCKNPLELELEARDAQNQMAMRGGRGFDPRSRKLKVLDMGCGKGGDLQKWAKVGTSEYYGFDIADVSIQQAVERISTMRNPSFQAKFYVMDCYSNPISSVLDEKDLQKPFDVVSMQFCMHYAFQSEEKVRTMLTNVAKHLKYGGMFVGTIPDSFLLLETLNELPANAEELTFGNSVYKITFDTRTDPPLFGHQYSFYLQDAVDDVPEYIVPWEYFKKMAAEEGLKLVYYSPFGDIFTEERERPEFRDLMTRMNVVNAQGESDMDEDMWDVTNLYVAFAFEKTH